MDITSMFPLEGGWELPKTKRNPLEPIAVGSVLRGWFTLMLPAGVVAWAKTQSVTWSVLAMLATPAVSMAQGTLSILNYRLWFADAPAPLAPAHGVVVVNPKDHDEKSNKNIVYGSMGCSCPSGRRWRRGGPLTREEVQIVQDASNGPPLRVLVIGDSLAVGVGTTGSCTPMMPEVIARALSKALGGRAVYWTCHGAAGASAQWIVREFERGIHYLEAQDTPNLELSDSSSLEDSLGTETESEEGSFDGEEAVDFAEWRQRLHRHRKRFDPDVMGPYDIAIVLSGPNDLKSALFPFLLYGEDTEFRKQARERGGSYAHELRRVLDALKQRMKRHFGKRHDDDEEDQNKQEPAVESIRTTTTEDNNNDTKAPLSEQKSNDVMADANKPLAPRPMVVFPGMPAATLPIFQSYPLRWFSVPCVGLFDNYKRMLARTHPRDVLFVEPPTTGAIVQFETQQGRLWEQRASEDTLLSLRHVRRSQCQSVQGKMKRFIEMKERRYGSMELYRDDDESPQCCQYNPPKPKLSDRPGIPGTKTFGIDNVHPNDEGYEFWGRYIADAIVKSWRD